MKRQKIDKVKLIAVFSLTTLIFIVGVFFGNYMTEHKIGTIQKLEQDLRTDTIAAEVQFELLTDKPCVDIDTTLLTDELYQIGSKISYMENYLGNDNEEVLGLKEYYSLLQIRHYLLMKKISSACTGNYSLITYFYSNKGDCPKCEQQGFILNYIRKKYENVRTYAYDINNNNTALRTMKGIYHVTWAPTIIIQDKVFDRFMTADEIEKELVGQ